MADYWIIAAIVLLILVGGNYAIACQRLAQDVRLPKLRPIIPFFLIGVVIPGTSSSLIPFLRTSYTLLSLSILSAVLIAIYLLSWRWRKKKAGCLVLDLGQTLSNKLSFGLGLLEVLGASYFTFSLIRQVSQENYHLSTDEVYGLGVAIFLWTLAILLISWGVSRLQLRENAFCYQYQILNWHKIISYAWKKSKPNTLTMRLKSKVSFLPKFVSFPIPSDKRNQVEYILANYVSGKTPARMSVDNLDVKSIPLSDGKGQL
jgi:hypothetical protein